MIYLPQRLIGGVKEFNTSGSFKAKDNRSEEEKADITTGKRK